MKKNSILCTILFFSLLSIQLRAQENNGPFNFPDIPGYKTLVCDFHMHTVFSDGLVWPTVRIDEAVNEGLDAISITEHLEYQNSHLAGDHHQSYDIAKPRADKKDLILIRGAEITRSMPPGHFNALFLKDANPLDTSDWKESIRIANEQGAFVFWNHPGWRQPDEIPIWYEEHSWLLAKGWIQGLEIVNENSYYALAHQWGIDSNLTLIGNSDIHDPIDKFFNKCEGEHRPVTLVFSKDRTEEGIKEAMVNKRTAIYYKNILIGSEEYLKPLFRESVQLLAAQTQGAQSTPEVYIRNNSSFAFEIVYVDKEGLESPPLILIPHGNQKIDSHMINIEGHWHVNNVEIAPGQHLVIQL